MKELQIFNFKSLVILSLVCLTFSLAQSDPKFYEKTNIQEFLKGLSLKLNIEEVNPISDDQFSLNDFILGLEDTGLSFGKKEQQQQGVLKIAKTLFKLGDSLPNKRQSLQLLVDYSLQLFGSFQSYEQAKEKYQESYPLKDINSSISVAVNLAANYSNFYLSGQVIGTLIKDLLPYVE